MTHTVTLPDPPGGHTPPPWTSDYPPVEVVDVSPQLRDMSRTEHTPQAQ